MHIHQQGRIFHYGLDFGMESWYAQVEDTWEYEYCEAIEGMSPSNHIGIWLYVLYNGDIEIQAEDEWKFFPSDFNWSYLTFGILPPVV